MYCFPSYGYRRIWAWLRFRMGLKVNKKKAVYPVMKIKHWFVRHCRSTPKPRVKAKRSRAKRSNERWAMDLYIAARTAHLAAVIDCHAREIVEYEFSLRGRANEAERALEAACLKRFGTLRPAGETPVLHAQAAVRSRKKSKKSCAPRT